MPLRRRQAVVGCILASGVLVLMVSISSSDNQVICDRQIIVAIKRGDIPAVETLLKRGANPNTRYDGPASCSLRSDLFDIFRRRAAEDRPTALLLAIERSEAARGTSAGDTATNRMAASLLTHGAQPDIRNPEGVTPLMRASAYGYARSVDTLLANGASVNAVNDHGKNVLMYGIGSNSPTLVQTLIRHSANGRSGSVIKFPLKAFIGCHLGDDAALKRADEIGCLLDRARLQ